MDDFACVEIDDDIHRIIASRYPTVGVFDGLVDDEKELRQLFDLEMMTNGRLNAASKRLSLIPEGGIVTGDTASQIMAAFVHNHEDGGRFNDGRLGAWYASLDVGTAIAETEFHLTRRLKMSAGGFPQRVEMRQLITKVTKPVIDIRGAQASHRELYDPDEYSASQDYAYARRWPFAEKGGAGICYDSVRDPGGTNICVFMPGALKKPVIQGDHYVYEWDAHGQVKIGLITTVK